MTEVTRYFIDQASLPTDFPTHCQTAEFWESLGRTVATFGLLEEVLCKAIFVFTATRQYNDTEINDAYEQWLPMLQRTLCDQLGRLIDTYGKVVKKHPDANFSNFAGLLEDMKTASTIRNVLCHGSWRYPDQNGASVPFFVSNQNKFFDTPINKAWLEQTRRHVAALICDVINTVTQMGWQFPGSVGPGIPMLNQVCPSVK
ncbi:MAG: hypothetical protein IT488_09760 [Gammaproteobacteria bacterium]|nr:hypothetical protein [Gammaproteobacteria bacterium]